MYEKITELLEKKDYPQLKEILSDMNEADIAAVLKELPQEKLPLVYRILPKELAAEVFVNMDSDDQEFLIRAFSDNELREVLDEMYVDDAVDVIEEMPATVVKRVKGEDGAVTETTVVAKGDKILDYDAFLGIVSTFGCADERDPSSIRIKCSSFDSKAEVERLIDEFTAETGKNIMYSDTLGMIMSFVEQMANTMTNVLVGFAAIRMRAPSVDSAPRATSKTTSGMPEASSIRKIMCSAWKPCKASGFSLRPVRAAMKPGVPSIVILSPFILTDDRHGSSICARHLSTSGQIMSESW